MRQPRSSTPPWGCLDRAPTVLADLRLRVVTPMFGGGATPGTADGDWPIRGSAIRGHLRFWWRACNARRFESLEEMYEEESRIWGAATKKGTPYGPGAISVNVDVTAPGNPVGSNGHPRMAVFPFDDLELPARSGVGFRLRLSLAPHVTDNQLGDDCIYAAKQALWAWITFGGVGARTRRGCGSLQVVSNAATDQRAFPLADTQFRPDAYDTVGWLQDMIDDLTEGLDGNLLVPSLYDASIRIKATNTGETTTTQEAIQAWRFAVEPMQRFRQGTNVGRNPGTGHPGQSRWPEPGAVRELGNIPAGTAYTRTPGADGRDFPRADLGLPILFQNMRGGNAPAPTLEGRQHNAQRMASPVILKALPLANNRFASLALVLNAPHPWEPGTPGLQLKDTYFRSDPTPLVASPMNSTTRPPHWPAWNGNPPNPPPCTTTNAAARYAFMDYLENAPDLHWAVVLP